MSTLRNALLAAADAMDADPVDDATLCKAVAACREASAFVSQELHLRAGNGDEGDARRRGYGVAIRDATQALLDDMMREVKARDT